MKRAAPGACGAAARKAERADELAGLVSAILSEFDERVLLVDTETACHIALLSERAYRQPACLPDIIIAATAVRHGLILLTHNTDEIGRLGIAAHDPFAALPPEA